MFKQLLSVFLESRCCLCDRTTATTICTYCEQKLISHKLAKCDRYWQGNLPVFTWGIYDGQLKQAIAKLKYHNQPEIGRILGKWLGEAWLKSSVIKPKKITVIPIPLHPEKQRERGFNQAELIAKGFCQETNYLLLPKCLTRVRNTQAMFSLNPMARQDNLKDAFLLNQKPPPYPVLLLDDIYTTGTTVIEVSKTLRQHNLKAIGVVVIAKAGNSNELKSTIIINS